MLAKIREKSEKWFYPKETFEIFNRVTLNIKDKHIKLEYDNYRVQRYRKLFPYLFVCLFLLATNNFITYFKKGDGDTTRLERPIYLYAMFGLIALTRWLCSRKQLLFFPLVMAIPLIWVQLTFRGIIEGHNTP